jgi:hypothetical protein
VTAGRALLAVAAAAALAGCGASVATLSLPVPPATVAPPPGSTTTVAPVDGGAVTEPGVTGATSTTSVALGPGAATITGTVFGPSGAVRGATVQVERLVGYQVASTELVTSGTGRFRLGRVLGGRYRVRAWLAPSLAMTTSAVFFVGDHATHLSDLQVQRFSGPAVRSTFDPDPTVTGAPVTVAVEVSDPVVTPAGTVDYGPEMGTQVQLIGGGAWDVNGSGTATTAADGIVIFTASCETAGSDPLTAVVGGGDDVSLHVPTCYAPYVPPPPPPSTATTTPSLGSTTTTTTRRSPHPTTTTTTSPQG